MKKRINIVHYDPAWPQIFEVYAKEIRKVLKENCIKVYHIGSTSVPGLCAKPKIDIMCVVKDLREVDMPLSQFGYEGKGEFNLPLRLFFSKRYPDDINLHVVNEKNGELKWNLLFRDYLRKNREARDMYAKVKVKLLEENPNGFNMIEGLFSDYTIKKGEVIRKISQMAGFNGYRFVIATNYYETRKYKELMDLDKIDFSDINIFHFCLYKGVEIVAVSCVEINRRSSVATVKSIISLDDKSEKVLHDKIEEWAEFHNLKVTGVL